jgi:hypothetical protein
VEAEALLRRALAIQEQLLGPAHVDLAPTLNNLAFLVASGGELKEAEELYRRAIASLEQTVEPTHPTLDTCRGNYTALLAAQRAELDPFGVVEAVSS